MWKGQEANLKHSFFLCSLQIVANMNIHLYVQDPLNVKGMLEFIFMSTNQEALCGQCKYIKV
jgi:hypothetical protein